MTAIDINYSDVPLDYISMPVCSIAKTWLCDLFSKIKVDNMVSIARLVDFWIEFLCFSAIKKRKFTVPICEESILLYSLALADLAIKYLAKESNIDLLDPAKRIYQPEIIDRLVAEVAEIDFPKIYGMDHLNALDKIHRTIPQLPKVLDSAARLVGYYNIMLYHRTQATQSMPKKDAPVDISKLTAAAIAYARYWHDRSICDLWPSSYVRATKIKFIDVASLYHEMNSLAHLIKSDYNIKNDYPKQVENATK